MLSAIIQNKISNSKKAFALLIDPDKYSVNDFNILINKLECCLPDVILVGGSLLFNDIHETVKQIKQHTTIPIYIFPGNSMQVTPEADGILFLSLISGRNAEFLIGNHVNAAPTIKRLGIKTHATGYILVESNNNTSVKYMSNTTPIPKDKTDIAIATALAGEMLGLQSIYLEAGSGADEHVSIEMIKGVKNNLNIPLIVGGGIRNPKNIEDIYNAGADIIVIGNAFEKNEISLDGFINVMKKYI